jgi:hypothetical protein
LGVRIGRRSAPGAARWCLISHWSRGLAPPVSWDSSLSSCL